MHVKIIPVHTVLTHMHICRYSTYMYVYAGIRSAAGFSKDLLYAVNGVMHALVIFVRKFFLATILTFKSAMPQTKSFSNSDLT